MPAVRVSAAVNYARTLERTLNDATTPARMQHTHTHIRPHKKPFRWCAIGTDVGQLSEAINYNGLTRPYTRTHTHTRTTIHTHMHIRGHKHVTYVFGSKSHIRACARVRALRRSCTVRFATTYVRVIINKIAKSKSAFHHSLRLVIILCYGCCVVWPSKCSC